MNLVYTAPHAEGEGGISIWDMGERWYCSGGEPRQSLPVRKVSRNNYKFAIETGNGTKQDRNNRFRGSIINSINVGCILIAGLMHPRDPRIHNLVSPVRTIESRADIAIWRTQSCTNFIFHHQAMLERSKIVY